MPAEGLLILRDGEPGEPEVTLSPLPTTTSTAPRSRRSCRAPTVTPFDTLTASIGAALAADRTLGGLCDWVEAEAPRPVDLLPVEGAAEPEGGRHPGRAALFNGRPGLSRPVDFASLFRARGLNFPSRHLSMLRLS